MRTPTVITKFIALLGLVTLSLFAHADAQVGVDYDVLPNALPTETPGKIEVIEFFWYKCPHCNEAQPHVKAWKEKLPKDVAFRTIHVNWPGRNDLEGHVKIHLTLKALGLLEAHHDAVFDAIFKDNIELRDEAKLFEWASKRGIDKAKFQSVYKSFGVQSQVNQLQKLTNDYRIDGTPSFIVNGKYKTKTQSFDKVFATIDELIAKERMANAKTAKPAPAAKEAKKH